MPPAKLATGTQMPSDVSSARLATRACLAIVISSSQRAAALDCVALICALGLQARRKPMRILLMTMRQLHEYMGARSRGQ